MHFYLQKSAKTLGLSSDVSLSLVNGRATIIFIIPPEVRLRLNSSIQGTNSSIIGIDLHLDYPGDPETFHVTLVSNIDGSLTPITSDVDWTISEYHLH